MSPFLRLVGLAGLIGLLGACGGGFHFYDDGYCREECVTVCGPFACHEVCDVYCDPYAYVEAERSYGEGGPALEDAPYDPLREVW